MFYLGVFLGSPTDFVVDSRAVAKYGQGVITCKVTNPSGTRTETFIAPQSDGTYKISYTPFEEGNFVLNIFMQIGKCPSFGVSWNEKNC